MRKLTFEEITERRIAPDQIDQVERFPIIGLLDNIRSLHNVGSIFRTSDGVRLQKLILSGITGAPPRKEIDKTALGAVETVPWEYHPDPVQAVRKLKAEGNQIVVLEHTSKSKSYRDVQFQFPCCLVVGNEVWGVQDEIVKEADLAIEIPMFGSKQSLNVTIAYGIVIYEILFQFLKFEKEMFDNKALHK
ncbi:MAG: RNA methyltransferase [Calditrichia bacterium]